VCVLVKQVPLLWKCKTINMCQLGDTCIIKHLLCATYMCLKVFLEEGTSIENENNFCSTVMPPNYFYDN